MNFFMDQGKVALVTFENKATQEEFERTLEEKAPNYLGCEIIQLNAGENQQVLQTFNSLLTRISLQQATHASDLVQANYLLWVAENEHFKPEFFQLLKKIIIQFPGLQLKLYIPITSDRWNEELFDIAGRKIAYWFVPASAPAANLAAPDMAAPVTAATNLAATDMAAALLATSATDMQAAELSPAQTAATMAQTADTLPPKPRGRNRNLNLWVSAICVLVLLAATVNEVIDRVESFNPTPPTSANTRDKDKDKDTGAHAGSKSEAADPGAAKPNTAPPQQTPDKDTQPVDENAALNEALNQWRQAWSTQNVPGYLSHYGPDFLPPKGLSRTNWEASRKERISSKAKIDIAIQNLQLQINDNLATAKFTQTYSDERLRVTDRKTLVWQKLNGRWLIQSETSE